MAIEIVGVDTVYSGWGRMLLATVRLPDGQTFKREIEDHGTAVAVLPYDAARRTTILVRQFRAPAFYAARKPDMLEAIAGKLDEVDPEAAMRREAMEEAGLRLGVLEPAGIAWAMPGVSTERMNLYVAPYSAADRIGPGGGLADEHEEIEVIEMPLAEMAAMVDGGDIGDMKTLVLAQTLRLRKPELF